MGFDLGNLLQQYLGGGANVNAGRAVDDFDEVARSAPRSTVAQGVTEALRSDKTPPFPQMVGQLFDHSDANQRAGMLNQLIAGVGPSLLASLGGGALGNLFRGDDAVQGRVTPEQAAQLTPAQVEQLAAEAEKENPGIVERMGDFYAEHPTLVKTIGGAALAIILGRVAEGMRH
jgi:hypothetical protein